MTPVDPYEILQELVLADFNQNEVHGLGFFLWRERARQALNDRTAREKAIAELAKSARKVCLLRDSITDDDIETDRVANCSECGCCWSSRECRVMLDKLSGKCQCGKLEFDLRASLAALGLYSGSNE